MTVTRPIPRSIGFIVLLAMAGFAAIGFFAIRKDVENLRLISQDNAQWSASQMEVELLRFRLSLQDLRTDPSPEAVAAMHERFDILWSRVFMMSRGRVGETLRRYDSSFGSLAKLAGYLQEIDPMATPIDPGDSTRIAGIERTLGEFQQDLREYTLRVVRAEGAASARVRERIQLSARTTASLCLAAVLISLLTFVLILRENRRQRQIAEMSQRSAEQAEQATRAKSRFLSMMSHELRNPLNGVLGPLALLDQAELEECQRRLVDQAQASGQSLMQMLSGLLDYGEIQDGRLQLRSEPFRVSFLASSLLKALEAEGATQIDVQVRPGTPERVKGDVDRLRQAFVHLVLYVLEGRSNDPTSVAFSHDNAMLIGGISFQTDDRYLDWKLDVLTGLSESAPDQVTAEALRPLIARSLISATHGVLSLFEEPSGRRIIRVGVPAPAVASDEIRVYLDTKSAALTALYQALLRSERVAFVSADTPDPVDVVLVDSTSAGIVPLISRLRMKFPGALFVSLGAPQSPDAFDDVVATPNDMSRLRSSILNRLAS